MDRTETVNRVFELQRTIAQEVEPQRESIEDKLGVEPMFFGRQAWKLRYDQLMSPINNHPAVLELQKIIDECPHMWGPWYEGTGPRDYRDCSVCSVSDYRVPYIGI